MSLTRTPPSIGDPTPAEAIDRPRRGRPPARNEILRAGRFGGLAPDELATRFGTPLYVYDFDVIDGQVAALRAVLPPVVDLAYATRPTRRWPWSPISAASAPGRTWRRPGSWRRRFAPASTRRASS